MTYFDTGDASGLGNLIEELCPILGELDEDISYKKVNKALALHAPSKRQEEDGSMEAFFNELVANATIGFAAMATAADLTTCASTLTDRLALYDVVVSSRSDGERLCS